jgi:polyphosphate kinase
MSQNQRYFNRELSWLSFNFRVLMEAKDESNPLFERIKFLAIYAANLDEFFRIKMGALKKMTQLGNKNAQEYFNINPKKSLATIYETLNSHHEDFQKVWFEELLPALNINTINLVNRDFSREDKEHMRSYFKNLLLSYLTPKFLINKNIGKIDTGNAPYLFVKLIKKGKDHFAIVNIPSESITRFFNLSAAPFRYVYIDDIVKENLNFVFPQYTVVGAWSFRIYRDESINIADEFAGNLVDKIRDQLQNGKDGLPIHITYDQEMPNEMLQYLMKHFKIKPAEVLANGPYQNLFDLAQLPNPFAPQLERPQELPICYAPLEKSHSIFDAIEKKDHLLFFPYHSYNPVLRFINEASIDLYVKEIRITLYRIASDSIIANALISAARNHKKVIVFVEVKARADEAHNLYWAEQMENAGITIIYSLPELKVHSKMALIYRQTEKGVKEFAYLSTGNFNENTAKFYADFGYFTCHLKMVQDLGKVFDFLYRKVPVSKLNGLLVSQYNLKSRFVKLIEKEIFHANQGDKAKIIVKVNNLEDHDMIDKLYEAADAGVQVTLIVRGICCIKPIENIEIVRIVDKFLEHARALYFYNNGNPKVYLSSADWMKRNLYHRVEIAFPIRKKSLRVAVSKILHLQAQDNVKAVDVDLKMQNVKRQGAEPRIRSQVDIYQYLKGQEEVIDHPNSDKNRCLVKSEN